MRQLPPVADYIHAVVYKCLHVYYTAVPIDEPHQSVDSTPTPNSVCALFHPHVCLAAVASQPSVIELSRSLVRASVECSAT